jgi:hypothetical protein
MVEESDGVIGVMAVRGGPDADGLGDEPDPPLLVQPATASAQPAATTIGRRKRIGPGCPRT